MGKSLSHILRVRISENLAEFTFFLIGFPLSDAFSSDAFCPRHAACSIKSQGNVAWLGASSEIFRGDGYASEIDRKKVWKKSITEG